MRKVLGSTQQPVVTISTEGSLSIPKNYGEEPPKAVQVVWNHS